MSSASPRTQARGRTATEAMAAERVDLRSLSAGPIVAGLILAAAFVLCDRAGVRVRDPDHVALTYLLLVGFAAVALVALDVYVRAARELGTTKPGREAMARIRRERWTPVRMIGAGSGLLSFYLSYFAYRNLKAIVPLLEPGSLFDGRLAGWDRTLLFGHDAAALLHSALGTGIVAQVLSTFYVAFIVFLPLSLAVGLVFAPKLPTTLFFATALSINWGLGAISYFLLPSLGPVYADPSLFAQLPHSAVTHLQGVLADQRVAYLRSPDVATPQSIAAFASLHISMSTTAAVAAQLLHLDRRLRWALWTWLAVTAVGTLYLGWHYLVDDLAGVAIALLALLLARMLTGPVRERAAARARTT